MNKKMIFAAIAAIAISNGIAGICIQNQESNPSALSLANIEALTSSTEESDCNYRNGYSSWKSERPWPWSDKETFDDCCQQRISAYSPNGSCS